MAYVFCGLLFIITLIKGKKRYLSVDILFLSALIVIGGLSTERPDIQVYYDFFRFHSLALGSISEPLYLLINTWASEIGMSYELFFAIQVAASLILIYMASKHFEADTAVVFMLFTMYPFAINIVQIRCFLSFSIVIYGLVFLYNYYDNGKKKGLVLFCISILIASLIHYSAAFFLICLIPILFRKMKTWKTMLLGVVAGLLLSNINILFSLLLPIIGARKAGNWLVNRDSVSFMHILLIVLLRGAIIGVLYLLNHTVSNNKADVIGVEKGSNHIDTFLYKEVAFLTISIFPLELFVQQYDRFSRVYLVLLYMLISRKLPKIEQYNRIIVGFIIFAVMILLCYYEYSRGSNSGNALWNTVLRSVFENNMLF